ncbi:protein of unknown function [Maridesulfovibrio hydrothermalis AM13 = DSM 14728]|uniref:Uncharacterized protein n=1 Tax=Maridesulfovibrio hydrothermalis AM13 = DSM 14728 TaxID=1121451 RepID=L0RAY5_9BACT|nr:protein of unknown function [Maridesulfovibrio hydrothermalis AM13 = DSM 14728]
MIRLNQDSEVLFSCALGDGSGGVFSESLISVLGLENPLKALLRNAFLLSEEMLAVWVIVNLLRCCACLRLVLVILRIDFK